MNDKILYLNYEWGTYKEEIIYNPYESFLRARFWEYSKKRKNIRKRWFRTSYSLSDLDELSIDLNTLSAPSREEMKQWYKDYSYYSTLPYFTELLPLANSSLSWDLLFSDQDGSSFAKRFRGLYRGKLFGRERLRYPDNNIFIELHHPYMKDDESPDNPKFLKRIESLPSNQIDKIDIYRPNGSLFCSEYLVNNRFMREWVMTYSIENLIQHVNISLLREWLDETVEGYKKEDFNNLFSHSIQDIIWEVTRGRSG